MSNILKDITYPKCCMNCLYYFVNDIYDNSFCTIDNQMIEPEICHIVKCKAFELWFGTV